MTAVPSIPDRDDRTLLRAWSGGRDEAAFTQFVQRHLGMVQGSALRKTGRPELAEEVAQAVFALAARRAAVLAEHPCAGAWLHRTAILESANAARRERKHRKIAAAMLIHPDTSPESGLPDAVLPHLDDALNSLPEHDRRAVLLRFGERLSYDQMAVRLGKSADACQKQTSRALERLRGLLSRHAAVPVTAVAAGLAAALTTTATATAGKVSAAAIAAAPKISLGAILQHILHTMNTGKQIAAAAGAVILLASVPLGLQISEAGALREKIAAHSPARPVAVVAKVAQAAVKPPREEPGSRIPPGVSKTEADRIVAMLRSLRGRMITSVQLVDIAEKILDLPASHMEEALKALADFPGMVPALPLRLVVFSRWTELDPNAAMSAGETLKNDPIAAELVKFAVATGWLERDPHGLVGWLRDHPLHGMTGTLSGMLLDKISLFDRETVQELREVATSGGFPGDLLMDWEEQAEDGDVMGLAKKLLEETPEGYHRGSLLRHVAGYLSEDDPRAAVEFLLAHPDSKGIVEQDALGNTMDEWAKKDLEAAAAWAWTQNRENLDGTTHVWKALSKKSEEEILAFIARAPDETARIISLERTALESVHEPEKSLHLIARLPEESRLQAMQSYGKIQAGESLMKTSEWLLTLPDGPDKDAAIRGFAPVLAQSEVESAMVWAANIAAEKPRTELVRKLGQEWFQRAPDAAKRWMDSTDQLTDSDRAAITAKPVDPASGPPVSGSFPPVTIRRKQ